MKRVGLILIILFIYLVGVAQDSSLKSVMKLEDYISLVLSNHPVVKQARLLSESADAGLLQARGGFDPKISSSLDLKNFKDKEYYDLFNTTLKFPSQFPLEPKISFDRNEGVFINPESAIPDSNNNRQISAGLSLPIGKGLFIDERRLAVQQAKIYQNIADAEQTKMVNKILLAALKDYWAWYTAHRKILLLQQSVDIADELFDRVMLDYKFGELAVVDTIQAKITYQSRQVDYAKAIFELQNARLLLETHLWSPEETPVALQESAIPDIEANFGALPSESGLNEMMEWAKTNHPEVRKLDNKIKQLEVENKWNRESLKPQIDLSYTFIDAPISPLGDANSPSFSDNYKIGVDFSFPIFLRKERGKIQRTNIKLRSSIYEMSQIKLSVKNNILTKYAETQMSGTLSRQYEDMAANYNRLLEAELLNLETGESDLFKLNIQQDKLIAAQLKYLDNLQKFQKNKAEILFAAGLPFLNLN
ncbi:MAG: outer membrane protein TolC [Cyclobacteriaceae bacterium]|jgi:outer membrane protein TolC